MDWQQFHTTLGPRYNKVEGRAEITLLYPYFHLLQYMSNGVHNCHMEIRKHLCGLRNRYTATHPIKFEYNNKRIFGMCSTRLLST